MIFSSVPYSSAPFSSKGDAVVGMQSAIVATSTMTASVLRTMQTSASMTATSVVTADVGQIEQIASPIFATSSMSASSTRIRLVQPFVQQIIVATSGMTSSAVATFVVDSNFASQSTMSSGVNRITQGASVMNATSALSATANLYWENITDITELWTNVTKPTETWTDEMPFRRVA